MTPAPGRPTLRLLVTGPPGSGAARVATWLEGAPGSWGSEGELADADRLADPSLAADPADLRIALDADDTACLARWRRWGATPPPAGAAGARAALADRRRRLAPARTRAQVVLDSSGLDLATVRRRAARLVSAVAAADGRRTPLLVAESFAFRGGVPSDCDWCVDTRFLRNPYWEPALRPLSGRDPTVHAFVLGQPAAQLCLRGLTETLERLRPAYRDRGRPVLRVAFGCTGGRHRSVAMARAAARRWRARGWPVLTWHRDCG